MPNPNKPQAQAESIPSISTGLPDPPHSDRQVPPFDDPNDETIQVKRAETFEQHCSPLPDPHETNIASEVRVSDEDATQIHISKESDATVDLPNTDAGTLSSKPSRKPRDDGTAAIGKVIGDYEILSVLGRGGMGVVYRARHLKLNRIVAIKMILHSVHGGSTAINRFLAEAQAVAALQHPGIVQIFEIGEHDSLPFIALEFVDGEDLQSATAKQGHPWNPKAAAELTAKLCDAMQYAHEHKILHRDIKPANILLDAQRQPKISDFGLAKKLDTGDQQTRDGTVMGTPSYMPPEQARGDSAAISNRSDIYSIGAVLYQLLTSRAPFVSDSMMETLTQVLNREPIQPRELQPGIPLDLDTICFKALQKDPSARYPTCQEFAADLRRFLAGEPILARPITLWERLIRWCKRNPKIAIPTALATLSILVTTGVSLWAWQTTAAQSVIIAQERDEANDQREEAVRQRILANQQQALAEENAELAEKQANLALQNIQFIVTDIDTKLSTQPGSSAIRIAIMEAVSKKWDELDLGLVGGIRGKAIPTLMSVRQRIANSYTQLDRINEAEAEFKKLEDMARERIVLKEGTDISRLNLARILFAASSIQRRINRPEGVEAKLTESRSLLQDILKNPKPEEIETNKNTIQQLLAAISQNLAADYLRDGKVQRAVTSFEEALQANEQILKLMMEDANFLKQDPQKQKSQLQDLKISIDKGRLGLAYTRLRLGEIDKSIAGYEEAIAERRKALEEDESIRMQAELAQQLGLFGRSLLWIRNLERAEPVLTEAVKLSELVYKRDPEKTDLKRSFALALYHTAVLRDLQNKSDQSLGLSERARGLLEQLFKTSSDDKNRINLMLAEARVGNVQKVIELDPSLDALANKNPELQFERACALVQLTRHEKDPAIRDAGLAKAIAILERAIREGYSDPFRCENEPDLEPFRQNKTYQGLIEQLRR